MLSEQQCSIIETGLTENVEPRKVAAYLCLHMGLMLGEVAALRWRDIDMVSGEVSLRNYIGKPGGDGQTQAARFQTIEEPRTLPMPPQVMRYLDKHGELYEDGDCFIMTGDRDAPIFYMMQNLLTSISLKYKVGVRFTFSDLRNAFIRRCIESGMDLYSLCLYLGVKQPKVIVSRFREYFKPRLETVSATERYTPEYKTRHCYDPASPKRMNLLILGAGGQGHVVKETAEAIGVFDKIAFLDDDVSIPGVIDSIANLERYADEYPLAFVAIGNNELRKKLVARIEKNFIVPVLRHPTATISPTVVAGAGTIFEAKVIVNAVARIGKGVILASACVVDHGCVMEDYVHVDVGAMIKKDSVIPSFTKVKSGSIYGVDSG